jgi:hypothetical protein
MPFGHGRPPVYDGTLPPIARGVKSIPFNEIIRNLENCRPYACLAPVARRQQPPTSSHPGIESPAVVGDTAGQIYSTPGRLT